MSAASGAPPFRVAFLVYPGITQLDLTGAHEVFCRVPGAQIHLHWKTLDLVIAGGGLALTPTRTFADVAPTDLLCVPGGPGQIALMVDDEVLAWVRATAAHASWVTSVCTGSLVLAAAGLLTGYRATTHWTALDDLALLGALPQADRVVVDRDRITGAGVTSGIDFALAIVGQLFGEQRARAIHLSMEYDPAPPWPGAGSPRTAQASTLERLSSVLSPLAAKRRAATEAAAARVGNYGQPAGAAQPGG